MKCQNVFKHAASWNKPEQSPSEGTGALQDAEVGGRLENLQKCEEEASWGSRASSSCGALPDPKHPCDHPQAQTIH